MWMTDVTTEQIGRSMYMLTGLALLANAVPALAVVVSPEAIAVPNLLIPEAQLGDARKHFVFHKVGVSFDQAQKDLTFCRKFLSPINYGHTPSFAPWSEGNFAGPVVVDNYPAFGLIGAGIASMATKSLERDAMRARLFRCMVPRGYARYRTSEYLWNQINNDESEVSIRIQSAIASGPIPPTPQVLP